MIIPQSEMETFACDLTAIPASERQQHLAITAEIFQAAEEVQNLPDGFALALPNEPGMFMRLARFVENERRCCPFLGFALQVQPRGGPLWLRQSGGGGHKEAVQAMFDEHLERAARRLR